MKTHDKLHGIALGITLITLALMAAGCSAIPKGALSNTSTVQGVKVKVLDVTGSGQSPLEFYFGLIRDEYVFVDTNAVNGIEMSKQTSYESLGWFKGNRVQTSLSFGKVSVTQPSQNQQMPSLGGSNVVWQPTAVK